MNGPPIVYWRYNGEELALYWFNPWQRLEEKIATFWWPVHPIDQTEQVEKWFEEIASRTEG